MYLLFIFTMLSGNTCAMFLQDGFDRTHSFDRYQHQIAAVDVYPDMIDDRIVDRLFPHTYTVEIDGKQEVAQCN